MCDVHDLVAHEKEVFAHQGFGKEIRHVVRGRHERHAEFTVFDALADEVVTTIDVLSPRVMLGVVSEAKSQSGPWAAFRNSLGFVRSPRSAGFSTMNSVPAR